MLVLLIICTLNKNGNILPLTWTLVPNKNKEYQNWFIRGITPHFPTLSKPKTLAISDRQKKFINTITEHLPTIIHNHYYQHIADNVAQNYSITYTKQFQQVARGKTSNTFKSIIKNLAKKKPNYATYLYKIPLKKQARYVFPIRQ